MRSLFASSAVVAACFALACSSSDEKSAAAPASHPDAGGGGGPDGGSALAPPNPKVHGGTTLVGPYLSGDCDPIVPEHCLLPFPSDVYLVADDATVTGRHVEFGPATLPANSNGVQAAPDEFRHSDGYSPGAGILTFLSGATIDGLPGPLGIADSLKDDCPTVLIDAETGQRVPHFAEVDVNAATDDERAFIIRPVVRLEDATRYIVAIRNVKNAAGDVIPPSPVFQALRDGTESDEPSVAARRALYADVFARLAGSGVEKNDLQIAWDFTTASRENNTRAMLHMRDEALAALPADGPAYTIDQVDTDPSASIHLRITGKVTVPLYLDKPEAGAKMVFGDDGLPKQNGTAEYPFEVIVPPSATKGTPALVAQNGHGLFGDKKQVEGFADEANEFNWVLAATDFIGMAGDDVPVVAGIITGGDIGAFRTVPDRMQQGYLNMMLVTRMLRGGFAKDPLVQFGGKSALDTKTSYYFGGSEGGILGATFMALTTDITRGGLEVAGQPYDLLLNRSVDFDPYWALIRGAYPNALDVQLLLDLVQMLWDRGEPTGYSKYIVHDPLPGTPAHDVFLQLSIGDHQVSTLGGHILARTMGIPQVKPVNRSIFGIDEVDAPVTGSGLVEYDFGLPAEPTTNVPDRDGEDPHGKMKGVPAAGAALRGFLETGVIQATCDGKCDPG